MREPYTCQEYSPIQKKTVGFAQDFSILAIPKKIENQKHIEK